MLSDDLGHFKVNLSHQRFDRHLRLCAVTLALTSVLTTGCLRTSSDVEALSSSASCEGVPCSGDAMNATRMRALDPTSTDEGGELAGDPLSGSETAGEAVRMTAGTPAGTTAGGLAGTITHEPAGEVAGMVAATGGEFSGVQCDITGFLPAVERAVGNGLDLSYLGSIQEGLDEISMKSYDRLGGPKVPGVYSLDGNSVDDCRLCLFAKTACNGDACKEFYAEQGEVEFLEVGLWGNTRLLAQLRDVVFREYGSSGDRLAPIADGLTWCIDEYTINIDVEGPVNGECDRPDVNCLGEPVPDFQLLSCEYGSSVTAHSLMETSESGLWMQLSTAWSEPEFPDDIGRRQLSAGGVNVIYVLGEGDQGEAPSISRCHSFAAEYDIPLANLYIDELNGIPFYHTFNSLWPYQNHDGSMTLPVSVMIRSESYGYEYIYTSNLNRGGIDVGLERLINPQ